VLRCEGAGRVRQLAALGSAVSRERPVADVRALGGAIQETLWSPVEGWLAAHQTYGFVDAGADVAVVFEAT
jgi:predicted deacylase